MLSKDKTSFVLYTSFYDALQDLPMDRKGMLLDLIFKYEIFGDTDEFEKHFADLPNDVKMAFRFIKGQLDKDQEKWRDVCAKRAEAGRKSADVRWGSQDKTNVASAEQNITKITNVKSVKTKITKITDNEYDNDNEYENDVCDNARTRDDQSQNTHTQITKIKSRLKNKFYVPGKTDAECMQALAFMRTMPNNVVVAAAQGNPADYSVSGKEIWHTGARDLDMAAGRRVWDERLLAKLTKEAANAA